MSNDNISKYFFSFFLILYLKIISLAVLAAKPKSIKLERSLARLPDSTLEVFWIVLSTNGFMLENVLKLLERQELTSLCIYAPVRYSTDDIA
jgi:hypothetical protein